jgi:hypothetical protein
VVQSISAWNRSAQRIDEAELFRWQVMMPSEQQITAIGKMVYISKKNMQKQPWNKKYGLLLQICGVSMEKKCDNSVHGNSAGLNYSNALNPVGSEAASTDPFLSRDSARVVL